MLIKDPQPQRASERKQLMEKSRCNWNVGVFLHLAFLKDIWVYATADVMAETMAENVLCLLLL